MKTTVVKPLSTLILGLNLLWLSPQTHAADAVLTADFQMSLPCLQYTLPNDMYFSGVAPTYLHFWSRLHYVPGMDDGIYFEMDDYGAYSLQTPGEVCTAILDSDFGLTIPTLHYQQNGSDLLFSVKMNFSPSEEGKLRFKVEEVLNQTPSASSGGTGKLNDTGLTWGGTYPSGNNTTCTGETISAQDCSHGRDALAAAGQLPKTGSGKAGFDFTKIDGGNCVQDNVTGLLWEVKPVGNGTVGDQGLHDADDTYNWYDTNSATNGGEVGYENDDGATCHGYQAGTPTTYCNTQAFVARVNQEGWCGYTDGWRMPSLNELNSIVDYSRVLPAIDTNFFPDTKSAWYWSGSPNASSSSYAWSVGFSYGNDYKYNRYGYFHVRLVRGGQ